eukprot:evm.model.NODE_43347_length_20623_cov_19.124037.1
MRVEVDLKLREKEFSLLRDLVDGAQAIAPVITEMGVLTKLVLVGAGALVCVGGGSAFCKAVVTPFKRREGRKGERRRRRKEEDETEEDGVGREEGL